MAVTKRKLEKLLAPGDTVFVFYKGGYLLATVNAIEDDGINTNLDFLFLDEIGETWCLCECTAKKITRESQKNVL